MSSEDKGPEGDDDYVEDKDEDETDWDQCPQTHLAGGCGVKSVKLKEDDLSDPEPLVSFVRCSSSESYMPSTPFRFTLLECLLFLLCSVLLKWTPEGMFHLSGLTVTRLGESVAVFRVLSCPNQLMEDR